VAKKKGGGRERDDSTRNRNAFDINRQHPTTIASARKNKRNKTRERERDRAVFFGCLVVGYKQQQPDPSASSAAQRLAFPSTMMGNHAGQVHSEFDLLLTSTPAPSFFPWLKTKHTHTKVVHFYKN
jgi:hypothetical protein